MLKQGEEKEMDTFYVEESSNYIQRLAKTELGDMMLTERFSYLGISSTHWTIIVFSFKVHAICLNKHKSLHQLLNQFDMPYLFTCCRGIIQINLKNNLSSNR